MAQARAKCIGILTSGGDCPGLNAAIRGVAKPAMSDFHIEVIGIEKGFRGLVENNARVLHLQDVSGILSLGGTILGTSREKPHKMPLPNGEAIDLTSRAVETYNRIDNDLAETDITFGFDSAVNTAAEAIDRLYSTAEAHLRVMVIELMGNNAGWLALTAGLAGGADIILIPEIPYDIDSICQHLTERRRRGKWFSIIAVAEGARPKPGKKEEDETDKNGKKKKKDKDKEKKKAAARNHEDDSYGRVSTGVAKAISRRLGMETRVTVLGHLQRGGIPTPFDRVLATRFGTFAAEMLAEGKYNHMVCMKGAEVTSVPLEKVAGRTKLVPLDHPLIRSARRVGTNFGD